MRRRSSIALFASALLLPAAARNPDTPLRNGRNSVQLKPDNGSTLTGDVRYISPDARTFRQRYVPVVSRLPIPSESSAPFRWE